MGRTCDKSRTLDETRSAVSTREESDEFYVIDLCELALRSKASRQHRFDWLRGDFSEKKGTPSCRSTHTGRRLGSWSSMPRQHDEAVSFFDKPNVLTISGVHRGEQRRIYDQRRVEQVPQHGLTLVVIPAAAFSLRAGKILRNADKDLETVRASSICREHATEPHSE